MLRRGLWLGPWLLLATLLAFSLGDPALVGAAKTVNVEIGDNFFKPDSLTVQVGDTIVWSHMGNRPHNVTADGGAFSSEQRMANGQTFTFTATTAGTYSYICTIHPNQMKATLVVQGAAGAAPGMPRTGAGGQSPDAEMLWWGLAGLSLAGGLFWAAGARRRRPAA